MASFYDGFLLLFGFRGRIGRATWWITGFIWGVILTAAEIYRPSIQPPEFGKWLFVAVGAVYVLSVVALGIKRLHDRDKSGWRLLIFFLVPGLSYALADTFVGPADDAMLAVALYAIGIAAGVWAFIELGLLPGTRGQNRYGPDPVNDYD
jgi:uncharacterized membrane protein YhaH (DUF805 family)